MANIISRAQDTQEHKAIALGDHFPRIEGLSLAGTRVSAPDDFKGKVTLITMAFVQNAQSQIDTWAKPTLDKFAGNSDFAYLELPIISKSASFFGLGESWINKGMRSGIDPKMHGSVVTLYTELDPYYTMTGENHKLAYIYLLDINGNVVGRWSDSAKPGQLEQMHKQIEQLIRVGQGY
jgi:ATP10 protein